LELPDRERAEIRPEKIRGYLLSSNLGALARSGDAERVPPPYGEKFRIVGRIVGPNGRSVVLLSIWLRRHGDPIPRLVTVYPAR
jgi:hypothetical protein